MTELLRVKKVSDILDCSRKFVYQLVSEGKLSALRMSPRNMRILKDSLDNYINEKKSRFNQENENNHTPPSGADARPCRRLL
ncbi:MAG TPA: helix-turn-helix domain-containing protein [Candidatus Sumerlaeota bacterium]|nr:MAG: Helix-turn-helix domain protein [candidate division BRC1 bacterium ADurb.Bin183]HOE63382.1 helix-turn-helix domain-containing protein [Candidatus Sumerlaeota bacterium]HRR29894.1 helix-turn-helix domain-containing protein [Candidatus Sumerlaeia bacterium]HON50663.1 helix-turn-helix domain-containing protein [Candidatus Sumerlaeota bacterium]HOR65219.1 helix-turn-helix domain-containing protein [Candidatus Sumerlaeota bacterium]